MNVVLAGATYLSLEIAAALRRRNSLMVAIQERRITGCIRMDQLEKQDSVDVAASRMDRGIRREAE